MTRGTSPIESASIGMYNRSGGIGCTIDSVNDNTARLAGPKRSKKSIIDSFHDMSMASFS